MATLAVARCTIKHPVRALNVVVPIFPLHLSFRLTHHGQHLVFLDTTATLRHNMASNDNRHVCALDAVG
jgi:hypothetical protein